MLAVVSFDDLPAIESDKVFSSNNNRTETMPTVVTNASQMDECGSSRFL